MSTVKKGILSRAGEWAKHLRPLGKRSFWGRHRAAEREEINDSATGHADEDYLIIDEHGDFLRYGWPKGPPEKKTRGRFLVEYRWRDEEKASLPWAHKGWKSWPTRYKTAEARDQAVKDMNKKERLWEFRAMEEE